MSIAITVSGQSGVYTSMHDALAVAAAGDTITVTMVKDDVLTGGNNDNGAGKSLNYVVTGGTVANNIAAQGGFVQLTQNATFTATNVLFYGNTGTKMSEAWMGGGAVSGGDKYASSMPSTMILSDCTFTRNVDDHAGGALVIIGPSTINNCVFDHNLGGYGSSGGGALLTRSTYTMTLSNVQFIGNTAGNGSGGAIIHRLGNLTINAGTIRNVFSKNIATRDGGALGIYSGWQGWHGVDFIGNTAAGSGGAIYITSSNHDEISDATFRGNTAKVDGGAIYSNTGSDKLDLYNVTFEDNVAGGTGGALYNANVARIRGGVKFLTASDTIYNAGTLNITAGTNYFNASITGTGAINVSGNTMIFGNTAAINIAGLTFSGTNAVKFNGSEVVHFLAAGGQDLAGASITIDNTYYAPGTTVTVATGVAGVGTVNFTTYNDRFSYTLSDGTLTYSAPDLGISVTPSSAGRAYITMAAALAAAKSGDTITVTVANNAVLSGGNEANGAEQELNYVISGGTVAKNIATAGGFVRLCGTGHTLTANGVLFSGNTSKIYSDNPFSGGGVITDGVSGTMTERNAITISNCVFSNNRSAGQGGAINSEGSVTITDSEFNYNFATGDYGGAIFLRQNGALTRNMSGVSFTGNTAQYGGAIANFLGNSLTLHGESGRNIFTNNVARGTSYGGGALYVNYGANINIAATDFIGNTAARYGGAIYLNNSNDGNSVTLSDATFSGNTAANDGGAIYNTKTVRINGDVSFLTGSDTIYNTGTLHVTGTNYFNASITGTGTINVNNGTMIFGNTAAIDVAALTLSGSNAVTINGAVVNFTSLDLSDVAITVNGDLYAGSPVTVATGVTAIGNDWSVTGASGDSRVLVLDSGNLVLTAGAHVPTDEPVETFVGSTLNFMTGGTITKAFFGMENPTDGTSIVTTVTGGTVGNALIAGAKVTKGHTADLGAVTLNLSGDACIKGGTANGGMLYTAGYAYGKNSTPTGTDSEVTLSVTTATLNLADGFAPVENLYTGAHARQGALTQVTSTAINVTGGTYGRVYGGGWGENYGRSEVSGSTIAVSGGTLGYIYAGGGNSKNGESVVTGNVTISVSGSAQVGIVFLAGKNQNCSITGNVTMTVSGPDKSITRISGWNANGDKNTAGLTTLNVETNLSLQYLDNVKVIRIAEGKTMDVSIHLWHEAAAALTIDFDLATDNVLSNTDWIAMSGDGMEVYQAAQYTIDNGAVCRWNSANNHLIYEASQEDSGYALEFFTEGNVDKVKFKAVSNTNA